MKVRSWAALAAAFAAFAAATPALAADGPPTLSDAQKRELILDVLERFVPHVESYWRASDLSEPRSGYWDADGPGVTQPRGAGNMAMVYATLLTAHPDRPSFGGVDRDVMREHVIQAIRHEALTSKLSGAGYDRWGSGTWQASLEAYGWGYAAQLLWDDLDADTRALVKRVITGEADILIDKPIASGEFGDTGAEDNGWNAPTPALAAVLFPDDPHRAQWEATASKLALNASSTSADHESDSLVDGRPLRDWMASVNLHPDLTMENHGFFNPIYQQVTHTTIGDGALIYAQASHPVPQAFSFRTDEVWDRVLGPLVADDGDFVMTAGQDWTSKDYQHLDYLSILATRFRRAEASVAESRALALVARRQTTHADGSILGQPKLGYESMLVKRLAATWWNHTLFGPSPQPTAEQYAADRERTGGVREYPYIDVVEARLRDAFVSMSWDDVRAMGLIVPAATGHADDPVLAAYPPRSLVGSASGAIGPYACDCRANRFSTAGSIGSRKFSLTAFPDGTSILLDRGDGSTFNVAFERIPGMTGERPVYHGGGEGLGDLPGSWANVADRLGMVVAGGGGLRARDVVAANPYLLLEGSAATGSGNRGALVLPLADRATTERLAATVEQPATPDGWSALYGRAADGSGRLATARWDGPGSARLALRDPRGAPVTRWPATATGDTAQATIALDRPASTGELVRYFVDADAPVGVRAAGDDRARLVNDGDHPVHVVIKHVGDDGRELSAERVLAAGEQADARVIDGELITAGQEYEPLRAAADRAGALLDALAAWEADGTLSHGDATRLAAAARRVARELDTALAAATAVRPDTATAAQAADAARKHLDGLSGDGLPAEVADRLAADRSAIAEQLDRARTDGLAVTVRLDALDAFLPGETAHMRATILNRAQGAATGGRLDVELPAGWTAEPDPADLGTLEPGDTRVVEIAVHVPADTVVGAEESLRAALAYEQRGGRRTSTAGASATVAPLATIAAAHDALPLAAGGYNVAELRVTNHAGRAIAFAIEATVPDGLTATPSPATLELGPGETGSAAVELRDASVASGTSRLDVALRSAGAVAARASVELRHSDDLALNGIGAPWPAAFASGGQPAYPPALATDGSSATFWVSDGSQVGQGPSPTSPKYLGVDFGAELQVGSVRMVPRTNYGPRAYSIEVSSDGDTWRQVADVPAPANGPVTTTFAPTAARLLRLRITDSYDRVRPPRNVQVAALEVRG